MKNCNKETCGQVAGADADSGQKSQIASGSTTLISIMVSNMKCDSVENHILDRFTGCRNFNCCWMSLGWVSLYWMSLYPVSGLCCCKRFGIYSFQELRELKLDSILLYLCCVPDDGTTCHSSLKTGKKILRSWTLGLLAGWMLWGLLSGLYYKTITIVIMTIVSDATIWSVTFDNAS